MTSVFAIASLLGPILGGAIVDHTTWRWVFFLKYGHSNFYTHETSKSLILL